MSACAAHSVGQPAADINDRLAHFLLNFNLLWEPTADYSGCLVRLKFKKSAPNDLYYLQQAATPGQITQQNSLQMQECPKGSSV
jgi:hypothetical protein